MKKEVIIRKATKEDIPRILYITKIAFKSPFVKNGITTKPHESDTFPLDFITKKVFVLVAVVNDKIAGAVKYMPTKNNSLYIFQLAILKTYRGLKIGRMLISAIEKIAVKNMVSIITLDCMKEKNLHIYYQNMGYKIDSIKKVKDYHMVYLSKILNGKEVQSQNI